MPVIEIETRIDASIETVFDLARSIDLHVQSLYDEVASNTQ